MYELGNVIPRIVWTMTMAPETGVTLIFSKIDLKEVYWRKVVDEKDAWNFAYFLSRDNPDDPIQLLISDALQMG